MKAVILAGGIGTRLRPVTLEIPKPLVTVKKKPIVNYLIELFGKHGIKETALVIHKDHVEDYKWWEARYAPTWPKMKITVIAEKEMAGTMGALRYVRDWGRGEPLLVSNGDEIKDFDIGDMAKFHARHMPAATIALVKVKEPQHYGVAVMRKHRIHDFLEKPANPPSSYINSGLYILNPIIFAYDNPKEKHLMLERHLFPALAKERKLAGYKVKGGKWFDCGTLERWEEAINKV